MLYVLARSLAGGKREGILSALGTFLGGMVHVMAAALGVSIILARSAVAFAAVKYLGAAYLCFLGVRMMLDARKENTLPGPEAVAEMPDSARSPLWQGVATEVLNPKTAVFSFFHSAVRQSRRRTRVPAVRSAGLVLGVSEYLCRSDRYYAGWSTRQDDSLVASLPPPAANRNGRNHDWAGNLPGSEREQIGSPELPRVPESDGRGNPCAGFHKAAAVAHSRGEPGNRGLQLPAPARHSPDRARG